MSSDVKTAIVTFITVVLGSGGGSLIGGGVVAGNWNWVGIGALLVLASVLIGAAYAILTRRI